MVATTLPLSQAPPRAGEALPLVDKPLRMSYDEFLKWANEDIHAEWVNGEVIVHMPPKHYHQSMVAFLIQLLGLFVRLFKLGELIAAPFEMRATPDGPAREPDLLFVAGEHLERLTPQRLAGPADLIVEVVSDDSVYRDRVDKFDEYEAAGVREYWVIDPRPGKQRANFWALDAAGRYAAGPVDAEGIYHSIVLPGFWLRVEWLLSETPPDPLAALAQVAGPDRIMAAIGQPISQ